MPRKILIVEDAEIVLKAYQDELADTGLEILTAVTLLQALDVYEANLDVELIAVDGLFPHDVGGDPVPEQGRVCAGVKFIANARFHGTIVACSSEESLNTRMLEAGATHASVKGRPLCHLIRKILGLPPASS